MLPWLQAFLQQNAYAQVHFIDDEQQERFEREFRQGFWVSSPPPAFPYVGSRTDAFLSAYTLATARAHVIEPVRSDRDRVARHHYPAPLKHAQAVEQESNRLARQGVVIQARQALLPQLAPLWEPSLARLDGRHLQTQTYLDYVEGSWYYRTYVRSESAEAVYQLAYSPLTRQQVTKVFPY
ncbi:hypothetical protein CAI21_15120 [Alkalilimnicola ehrlichii]|uniref:Uncharacterized protein n=1 Tax=Alkalilimnicola ehrlichii TaxID=351052 RepID=A0A3E0WT30_9GAMM|nr:hypothetical protein CAI21_15120 [Alkalilimnicola ehrlichii]RFA35353.1 hypothetical protein CAL65_12780 [Alkalilimnicola ehrlichii]